MLHLPAETSEPPRLTGHLLELVAPLGKTGAESEETGMPSEPLELSTHHSVVLVQQGSPAAIAELCCLLGRLDDVSEDNGGEHPVPLGSMALTGDELLDRVDELVDIASVGQQV